MWETGSGRLLAALQGHTSLVYGVAVSGDGRLVASASSDGTVRLWEAPSGRLLAAAPDVLGPPRPTSPPLLVALPFLLVD